MSKKWINPEARVQEFVANEYVAACTHTKPYSTCNVEGHVVPDDSWLGLGIGFNNEPCGAVIEFDGLPVVANATLTSSEPDERVYVWRGKWWNPHATDPDSIQPANAS